MSFWGINICKITTIVGGMLCILEKRYLKTRILENYFKTDANYENEHDRDELRRRGFEELKLIGEIQVYQLLMNSDNDRSKL